MQYDDKSQPIPGDSEDSLRYCRSCGAPIAADVDKCPTCDPASRIPIADTRRSPWAELSVDANDSRGVRSALILYGLLLAASISSSLLPFDNNPAFKRTIVFNILMVAIVMRAANRSRDILKEALPGGMRVKHLLIAFAIVAVSVPVGALYGAAVSAFAGLPPQSIFELLGIPNQSRLAQLFFLAVLPAIFEELAFRGMILPYLANRIPVTQAVVVSSAAFAILHLSVLSMPFLFFVGLAFGWLRVRSESLVPPMLAHFLHNASFWALEGLR